MTPFVGQVMLFAGNFAPRGWALCDGQLLPISSYTALFSIIGTTYGGDGKTTFALPDLRGRCPIHMGHGSGLSSRSIGSKGGQEDVTLTTDQTPSHNHAVNCTDEPGNQGKPGGAILGAETAAATDAYFTGSATTTMRSDAIGNTGGSRPHNTMQPFLTMNYVIALEGVFPSRS